MKVQGVRKFGHILICLLPGVHFNMSAQNKHKTVTTRKNYCKARKLEEVINSLRALSHEEKQREAEKRSERKMTGKGRFSGF